MIDLSKMLDNIPVFKKAKKDPFLFEFPISFEPYNEKAYNKGSYYLTDNGEAFSGKARLGQVDPKLWAYFKSLGTSFDLVPDQRYNKFIVKVYGVRDNTLISPVQNGEDYIYRCGRAEFVPMIPGIEYQCEMRYDHEKKNRYDVYVGGLKAGSLENKNDRVPKLVRMLHTGYTATAQVETDRGKLALFVIIRKV